MAKTYELDWCLVGKEAFVHPVSRCSSYYFGLANCDSRQ